MVKLMRTCLRVLIIGCIVVVVNHPSQPETAGKMARPEPAAHLWDEYGGSTRLACPNKTGHFILTKINNRWWFCTPAGHALISMSVGGVGPASRGTLDCNHQSAYDLLIRKYGNNGNTGWAWQTLRRMTAWGFNSVGQDSVGQVDPWSSCRGCPWPGGVQPIKLPLIVEEMPIAYSSVNLRGYASSPLKDIMNGVNAHYGRYRAMLPDVFDPDLGQWWRRDLAENKQPAIQSIASNAPWLLGFFTDDSDYFWGSGAGTDFPTFPVGHNNSNSGYLTMISSPTQTYEQATQYGGRKVLYVDIQVHSKIDAASPTAPCSATNPCSLRDYLWQKYRGSITALNQAWGSNYTTFDSTGVAVKGEQIGTGDGTTRKFTHTLAHNPVSPNSLLIMTGGRATAGDCAWFHPNCGTQASTGSIGSPDASEIEQSASSIKYTSGAMTISFVTPPASGTVISVSYIYGGWMAGGKGLMDESGDGTWMGNNSFCLERSSSRFTVCVPGQEGAPDANPQTGADLDNWITQLSAEYFKTMRTSLPRHSSVPYLGLDTIGSWAAPASQFFLQGAAPYIDGGFVQLYGDKPSTAQSLAMYSYLTEHLGDRPLLDFITLEAGADSAESCHPAANTFSTQQARGEEYLNTVRTFLTTPGHNQDYPWVGFGWWAWQDFQNLNQGLVSIHDNAYDGKEAMKAPGKDPWGVQTGGEDADYGDCLTWVKQANALWYTLVP